MLEWCTHTHSHYHPVSVSKGEFTHNPKFPATFQHDFHSLCEAICPPTQTTQHNCAHILVARPYSPNLQNILLVNLSCNKQTSLQK